MKKIVELKNPLRDGEILSVSNFSCFFNEKTVHEVKVIDNFSYTFAKNKVYCIIGDSGSGKSTLVNHFNGLIKPAYGDIWVKDIYIGQKQRKIKDFKRLRKTISIVFQFPEYQLFKDTVEKDIMFGPIALGQSKNEARQKAAYYLEKMGLKYTFLERNPFELSGGQKRRVAIAGILAIEPEVLIFDEPTAGLDPEGEREMMRLIKDAKASGRTVFMITHQMENVLEVADEVLVLSKGQLVKSGDPYEVFMDEAFLAHTTIIMPPVIQVIKDLINLNPKFSCLLDFKPRNLDQLADAINNTIAHG